MVFRVELMPACEGDSLWITYGEAGALRHVLIDGGRASTAPALQARIEAMPANKRRFELIVVTHIDRDHIEGMIRLLEADLYGAEVGDFWFNGYDHLVQAASELEVQGGVMGEALSNHIARLGLPWNAAFDNGPVCLTDGPIECELDGGLKLTILSPTPEKLKKLIPVWDKECAKAGIAPGGQLEALIEAGGPVELEAMGAFDLQTLADSPFKDDRAEPNGSSIAMIAQYGGRSILLGADSHCDVLLESLTALSNGGGRVKLSAFKLPHHGSRANISRDVLDAVRCSRYLVSTNGSYFNHPDKAALARVIRYGGPNPKLLFNYRSEETGFWDDGELMGEHKYAALYPTEDGFLKLTL